MAVGWTPPRCVAGGAVLAKDRLPGHLHAGLFLGREAEELLQDHARVRHVALRVVEPGLHDPGRSLGGPGGDAAASVTARVRRGSTSPVPAAAAPASGRPGGSPSTSRRAAGRAGPRRSRGGPGPASPPVAAGRRVHRRLPVERLARSSPASSRSAPPRTTPCAANARAVAANWIAPRLGQIGEVEPVAGAPGQLRQRRAAQVRDGRQRLAAEDAQPLRQDRVQPLRQPAAPGLEQLRVDELRRDRRSRPAAAVRRRASGAGDVPG